MKVRILEEECTGCEACVEALDEIFEMTKDGELARVKVDVIPTEFEDEVEAVAEDCPAEAIIVE